MKKAYIYRSGCDHCIIEVTAPSGYTVHWALLLMLHQGDPDLHVPAVLSAHQRLPLLLGFRLRGSGLYQVGLQWPRQCVSIARTSHGVDQLLHRQLQWWSVREISCVFVRGVIIETLQTDLGSTRDTQKETQARPIRDSPLRPRPLRVMTVWGDEM